MIFFSTSGIFVSSGSTVCYRRYIFNFMLSRKRVKLGLEVINFRGIFFLLKTITALYRQKDICSPKISTLAINTKRIYQIFTKTILELFPAYQSNIKIIKISTISYPFHSLKNITYSKIL